MTHPDESAELLAILKEIRNEMRDHRALLLESVDQGRNLERHVDAQLLALNERVNELKDELELTIRSELIGLIGELMNGGSRSQ